MSVKKVLKEEKEEQLKKNLLWSQEYNLAFQYEADDMINKGYDGIKNGMDIQEILDWLDEHFYELTPSQKK